MCVFNYICTLRNKSFSNLENALIQNGFVLVSFAAARNNSQNLSDFQHLFLTHDTCGLSYQLWVCSTCLLISEPMLKVSGTYWSCERKRMKELVEECTVSYSFFLHACMLYSPYFIVQSRSQHQGQNQLGIYSSHRQGVGKESKYLLNSKAFSKPILLAGWGCIYIFVYICLKKYNDPSMLGELLMSRKHDTWGCMLIWHQASSTLPPRT